MNRAKLDVLAEQAEAHAEQTSPLVPPADVTIKTEPSPDPLGLFNSLQDINETSTHRDIAAQPRTLSSLLLAEDKCQPTTDDVSPKIDGDDNDDVETILGDQPQIPPTPEILSCGRDLLHLLQSVRDMSLRGDTFDVSLAKYHTLLDAVQKRLSGLERTHYLSPRELLAMERLRVLELKISEHLRINKLDRSRISSSDDDDDDNINGDDGRDEAPVGVVVTSYPDSAVLKQTTKYKNKPLRFVVKIVSGARRRYEVAGVDVRHELISLGHQVGMSRSSSSVAAAVATLGFVQQQQQQQQQSGDLVMQIPASLPDSTPYFDNESDLLHSPELKRTKTEVFDESKLNDLKKDGSLRSMKRSSSLSFPPKMYSASSSSATSFCDDPKGKPSKTVVTICSSKNLKDDLFEVTCQAASGTRKTPIGIRFVVTLTSTSPTPSNNSNNNNSSLTPLINNNNDNNNNNRKQKQKTFLVTTPRSPAYFTIITNECQYDGGNYELLRLLFFQDETAVPWPLFANRLQRNIITITKQTLVRTQRHLSSHELTYLYTRFLKPLSMSLPGARDSNPTVSCAAFEDFWGWYGKAVHQLKNSKNLHAMWTKGVFWGFASREEAERAVLRDGVPGAFVLRFSESNPGAFAACYSALVDSDGEQQQQQQQQQKLVAYHMLFPVNAVTQHHSLSDVVRDAVELEQVVVVSYKKVRSVDDSNANSCSDSSNDEDANEEVSYNRMEKGVAFKEFYSNNKPVVKKNGYFIK